MSLARNYIREGTLEEYWLSENQITIPRSTITGYREFLNKEGNELLDIILEKVKNHDYKDIIDIKKPLILTMHDSGKWKVKCRNKKYNPEKLKEIVYPNDNRLTDGYFHNKKQYWRTSIIRIMDPDLNWVYTYSGSLYKINYIYDPYEK